MLEKCTFEQNQEVKLDPIQNSNEGNILQYINTNLRKSIDKNIKFTKSIELVVLDMYENINTLCKFTLLTSFTPFMSYIHNRTSSVPHFSTFLTKKSF